MVASPAYLARAGRPVQPHFAWVTNSNEMAVAAAEAGEGLRAEPVLLGGGW